MRVGQFKQFLKETGISDDAEMTLHTWDGKDVFQRVSLAINEEFQQKNDVIILRIPHPTETFDTVSK